MNALLRRLLIAFGVVMVLLLVGGFVLSANIRVDKTTRLDGYSEKFFLFGKLMGERSYQAGELNGPTKTFYLDGRVKSEWNYKTGQRDGRARHYGPDGNLRYEETYAAGRRTRRIEYDAKGNVVGDRAFK